MVKIIFGIIFGILAILQYHNVGLYPPEKGFDSSGHIQYIYMVKNDHHFPLANEGWETYQPPLYYSIASLMPDLKSIQLMNIITWAGFCFVVYIFARRYFKKELLAFLSTSLVGSLPMLLYTTPMISNELFSGLMISISLVYYLLVFKNKKKESAKEDIILGILLSIAFLSKATSIVLVLAIILDTCFDKQWNWKEILHSLYKVFGTLLLLSGWFYIRNFIYFGNPLVLNTDFPGNAIHQAPGYRNLQFFIDPSGFLKLDIFHAHYYSLWAGIFYTWFFDGQNALVPVQEYSRIGVLLVVAAIPLVVLSLLGLLKTVKELNSRNRLLVIYPLLLVIFFIFYNFNFPFYSTVKAIYMNSLVIPWIYFLITGLIIFIKNKLLMILFGLYLPIYFFLILKNFWIINWWYDYMK